MAERDPHLGVLTRAFETPELKLLVDSVQSSKFITHKKTLALIKKIENLASIYDAQLLHKRDLNCNGARGLASPCLLLRFVQGTVIKRYNTGRVVL